MSKEKIYNWETISSFIIIHVENGVEYEFIFRPLMGSWYYPLYWDSHCPRDGPSYTETHTAPVTVRRTLRLTLPPWRSVVHWDSHCPRDGPSYTETHTTPVTGRRIHLHGRSEFASALRQRFCMGKLRHQVTDVGPPYTSTGVIRRCLLGNHH